MWQSSYTLLCACGLYGYKWQPGIFVVFPCNRILTQWRSSAARKMLSRYLNRAKQHWIAKRHATSSPNEIPHTGQHPYFKGPLPAPDLRIKARLNKSSMGGRGEKSSKSRMSFYSSSIHVAMTFLIEKSDSEKMTQCTASLVRAWLMRIRPAASLTFAVQDTQWLPKSDLKLHLSMKTEHTFIRQAQQRGLA